MINIKNDAIVAFLRKNKYEANIQTETDQVYAILNITEKEFPLFIRVFDGGHILQLLVFIPCEVKPECIPDLARLLHMLNKELDIPGFGMDEAAGAIFYRVMIPTPKKQVEEELLKAFVQTLERVCTMFAHPIAAVAIGMTKLEDIMKKAQDIASKKKHQ